ncbi:MAG: hypothetical protein DHS20C14_10450 [Phycisphaeraceae bacterium]|nr:MAG: hypothetical protein DHS20C14_10450 [Phycisphaeraceae bacterium]
MRVSSAPLDRAVWAQAWNDGLMPYDAELARVMAGLRVGKSPHVTVLVQTPTSAVEVCSMADAGGAAAEAARLRVVERVDAGDAHAASAAEVLAHDSDEEGVRAHVLALADANKSAQSVFGWVSRSGGKLVGYVPRTVVPLARTIEDAAELGDGCVACCYLDNGSAALASMHNGRLIFVRSISVGYQSLVEAYARGLSHSQDHPPDDDAPPVLEMDRAATLLFEHGVPSRDALIGQQSDPYRVAVAPLLAPVMQRLSVEIKQSVRYGVGTIDHRPRKLVLTGPGARIPGMASMLSETTELDVEVQDDAAKIGVRVPVFERGTTEGVFAHGDGPGTLLLPLAAAQRLAAASRTAAVRTGALVVLGLLLSEAGLISLDRRAVLEQMDSQRIALDEVRAEGEQRLQAQTIAEELNLAAYASSISVGEQPDWSAVLAEIGLITDSSVRVREFRAFFESSAATVALSGNAADQPGDAPGASLGRFIEGLKQSPLVERVELGSTRSQTIDGVTTRAFSVRCVLHAFPVSSTHPELYAGVEPKQKPGAGGKR